VSTRESRVDRGRRRGDEVARAAITQLRSTRVALGISQDVVAAAIGCSQPEISGIEHFKIPVTLRRLSEIASLLGLEPALTLHPVGPPLRDKGHEAVLGRLLRTVSPAWRVFREAPFPGPGDRRFWDALLRLPAQIVGIEAETRIRDLQALVRRMGERARAGGADVMLLVLSDSATNRGLVDDLRAALGDEFASSPRDLLAALRAGQPLPGSGVILI